MCVITIASPTLRLILLKILRVTKVKNRCAEKRLSQRVTIKSFATCANPMIIEKMI